VRALHWSWANIVMVIVLYFCFTRRKATRGFYIAHRLPSNKNIRYPSKQFGTTYAILGLWNLGYDFWGFAGDVWRWLFRRVPLNISAWCLWEAKWGSSVHTPRSKDHHWWQRKLNNYPMYVYSVKVQIH
jgi:hypothetical protein